MILRSVAVVSAVVFLATVFFSVPLTTVFSAEETKKEVCADFDESKGDKKTGDKVTKSPTKGGVEEGKKAITNSKLETTDEVKVKADGTVEVVSKCGKEGDVGKVNFCFPGVGGKEMCVSITKKKDEWTDASKKTSSVEKALTDAINTQRKNYLKEAAEKFKSGASLPSEYNALLDELAKGGAPFLCGSAKTACRDGAEAELRKLTQGEVEQLLGAVLDGDTDAINRGLRDAGKKFGVSDATIKRVSDSLKKGVVRALDDICKEVSTGGCGKFTEALKSVTGFAAPGGTPSTGDGTLGGVVEKFKEITEMDRAKHAIACIESSCGNYSAIGPWTKKGNRAYGKYQMMDFNIPSWTCQTPGVPCMTPMQLLRNPDAQEKVFEHIFGRDAKKHGWQGAALKWFTGKPYLTKVDDGYTSASTYLRKFNSNFGASAAAIAAVGNGSPFGSHKRSTGNRSNNSANTGIGGLLKSFLGGGSLGGSSGSSGGGGSFGGGGASGNIPQIGGPGGGGSSTSGGTGSVSNTQPLPPVTSEETRSQESAEPAMPSLSLVVHPSTAQKGESVNVIWSAVGVSTTRVCQLSAESTEGSGVVAEGNKGTKVIQVPVSTPLSELRFTLLCVPRDTRIRPEDARITFILKIN